MKVEESRTERTSRRMLSELGRRCIFKPTKAMREATQVMVTEVIDLELQRMRGEIRNELLGINPTEKILQLIDMVIDYYGINIDELQGKRRPRPIVEARQACHWLIRKKAVNNRLSLSEIGKLVGGADHATVLHSIKKFDGVVEYDRALRHELMMFVNKLGKTAEWNGKQITIKP